MGVPGRPLGGPIGMRLTSHRGRRAGSQGRPRPGARTPARGRPSAHNRHTTFLRACFTVCALVAPVLPLAVAADAPQFVGEMALSPYRNALGVDVALDKEGTCYAVAVPEGASEPTPLQVKNGQDSGGASAPSAASVALVNNTGVDLTESVISQSRWTVRHSTASHFTAIALLFLP